MESFAAKSLALSGSLKRPLTWFAVLSTIPFVIAVAILFAVTQHVPNTRAAPPLALSIAVPAIILLVQLVLILRMRGVSVAVGGGDLLVNSGLGSQRIALSNLRKHGLRVIDLRARVELRPFVRTMGAGLPGLSSGWFRLRNGERALCILFGRERVAYLRSDADNLSLLLSLKKPEELQALIERGRG